MWPAARALVATSLLACATKAPDFVWFLVVVVVGCKRTEPGEIAE
jgi:hypothetical protein